MSFTYAILPYFLMLVFVVGPIDLIWGKSGQPVPNFVEWWCRFVGVTDVIEIQTAIGVFSAISLLCAIYFIWSLLFVLIAALDAADRQSR